MEKVFIQILHVRNIVHLYKKKLQFVKLKGILIKFFYIHFMFLMY